MLSKSRDDLSRVHRRSLRVLGPLSSFAAASRSYQRIQALMACSLSCEVPLANVRCCLASCPSLPVSKPRQ